MNPIKEAQERARGKACKNPDCSISTAIDEETMTFGSRELDEHGFWQKPCDACARAYEVKHPEMKGKCWPFKGAPHAHYWLVKTCWPIDPAKNGDNVTPPPYRVDLLSLSGSPEVNSVVLQYVEFSRQYV